MKLRLAAFAPALLVISGCGGAEVSAPLPSTVDNLTDAAYVEVVQKDIPWFASSPADRIVQGSKMACGMLEQTLTDDEFFKKYLDLAGALIEVGLNAEEASLYLVLGAHQYCPDQEKRIQEFSEA